MIIANDDKNSYSSYGASRANSRLMGKSTPAFSTFMCTPNISHRSMPFITIPLVGYYIAVGKTAG